MRRIASVFRKSSSHSERSDAASTTPDDRSPAPPPLPTRKRTGLFQSRITISTESPLPPASNPGSSSASSCTDSLALRTPDDDAAGANLPGPPPSLAKKAWLSSWVGSRRSTNGSRPDLRQVVDPSPPSASGGWQSGKPRAQAPSRPSPRHESEDESDAADSEDDYDDNDDNPRRPQAAAARRTSPVHPNAPGSAMAAVRNLRAFTASGLAAPTSPPPLLHLQGVPYFPRSSSPSASLSRRDGLESWMHKRRLISRLDRQPHARSEELSIAPFASKKGAYPRSRRHSLQLNEAPSSKRIRLYSEGLQRWSERLCFEDRAVLWTLGGSDGLSYERITGRSGFGIAALEFSEGLEVLAGLTGDIPPDYDPPSSASSSSSQLPSTIAIPRGLPYKTGPSPLRIEHSPSDSPVSPLAKSLSTPQLPSSGTSPVSPSPVPLPPKPGVRFTSETKERSSESVPLGYALKAKRAREDKAKFLQEERERRVHEEERKKMEEERLVWEQERQKWDREKKAMEEERRNRKYAEEYAASRRRQSSQRAGVQHSTSAGWVPDRVAPQRGQSTMAVSQSQPHFEPMPPRRQASEPVVTTMSTLHSQQPGNSGYMQPSPWVQSPYSSGPSSSDDVRTPSGSMSKRSSLVSPAEPSDRGRARSRRSSTYSNASASGRPFSMAMLNANAPPVPAVPMMMPGVVYPASPTGEPLLPPAAPFMMQSYGPRSRTRSGDSDRRSQHSSTSPASGSAHSSSGSHRNRHSPAARIPTSHSSDRVNRVESAKTRPPYVRQSSGGNLSASSRSYSFQDPRMSMMMAPGFGMQPGMPMPMSPVGMWGMPMAPVFVPGPGQQPLPHPAMSSSSNRQSVIF